MPAVALLEAHGGALEAVAKAEGAPAGVAAALAGAALGAAQLSSTELASAELSPHALCAAYASGLDGKTLDSTRLLALARGAVDSLNTASHLGCAEATDFLAHALHGDPLFTLVFRDARDAQAAVELQLCDETVAAFELACRRASQTVTRPVKPGAMVRTICTRPDGTPLHSFVLFDEDSESLSEFVETYVAETCPRSAFIFYAGTHLRKGVAASEAALMRAGLGERYIAAATEAYVALVTVTVHNIGVGSLPTPLLARLSAAFCAVTLTPREFEGLFLTLGRHQIGIAALSSLAVFAASSPTFARLLDPDVDGLAHILSAISNPALDEPTTNGCVLLLTYCAPNERFAQALVDKGAFTLLQPVIRRDNIVLAVRAAFAVASIAVACAGAAEPLRWSGVLDVITSALRPISVGSAAISGFLRFIMPTCQKLLQPGVEPALQLATLHRLAAGLAGTTSNAAALMTAPVLQMLRSCALSREPAVAKAAKHVLKELQQPLQAQLPGLIASSEAASARAPSPQADALALSDASVAAVRTADSVPRASPSVLPPIAASASELLAALGGSLEAIANSAETSVAAALANAAPLLRPADLGAAYASGLGDETVDAARLLVLARGAVDGLNAASHAGGGEATAFLSQALHSSGLFALVFRDVGAAQSTVMRHLCDETVAAFEQACRRAARTVTRPAKPGTVVRTVFTRADGVPLHSFALFGEDDEQLIDSFVETYVAEPCPSTPFGIFAVTRLSSGDARGGADGADGDTADGAVAIVRAQLGERVIAAASEAYIARFAVVSHNNASSRISAALDKATLSPRELEGLFLTIGRHHVGVATMLVLATLAPSAPAFARLIEADGLARVLTALSDPALDQSSINGCLIVLSYSCAHSEQLALQLVDKGAFTLLQPVIRHRDVVLAVRACFAVALIAVRCGGAAEALRSSGVIDLMSAVLHSISLGGVVISGYLQIVLPQVVRLLQPDVEPTLQLVALHRLGAALAGTTSNTLAAMNTALLMALRGCAASSDPFVARAAKFSLKELQQPLLAPPVLTSAASSSDLEATIRRLTETAAAAKAEHEAEKTATAAATKAAHDELSQRLEASEIVAAAATAATIKVLVDSGAAASPKDEHGEITREMLAGLLGRPSLPLDRAWSSFMQNKLSEDQLLRVFNEELAAEPLPAEHASDERIADLTARLLAVEAAALAMSVPMTMAIARPDAPPALALRPAGQQLVDTLTEQRQNFVIADARLPDHPIVFASQGFFALTGYAPAEAMGRNCRFLQGPATDKKVIEALRDGMAAGVDTSVTLVNYKKDGTMFYNSLFVAALRDSDGKITSFVGVQSAVSEADAALLMRAQSEARAAATLLRARGAAAAGPGFPRSSTL